MACHCIVKCAETLEQRSQAVELMREGNTQSYALGALALQGPCAIEAQQVRQHEESMQRPTLNGGVKERW